MSETDTMLDKVAMAIMEVDPFSLNERQCRAFARAAVEAMREPTDAMVDAGEIYSDGNAAWRGWQAMIDAALRG